MSRSRPAAVSTREGSGHNVAHQPAVGISVPSKKAGWRVIGRALTKDNHSSTQLNNVISQTMSTQGPKRILFAQLAGVAKCLSHPHRLELLEQLAQGARNVEALAQKLGLSIANTSQHLRSMLRAGIVTTVRDGKFVVYALADHS